MLQDFLASRTSISPPDSAEMPPRVSSFQPFFAARAAGLTGKPTEAEADPDIKRLEAPEIELVEEAGQVRRIIVTCTCCEKITIDCEY